MQSVQIPNRYNYASNRLWIQFHEIHRCLPVYAGCIFTVFYIKLQQAASLDGLRDLPTIASSSSHKSDYTGMRLGPGDITWVDIWPYLKQGMRASGWRATGGHTAY